MKGYNAPKDEGYAASVSYAPVNTNNEVSYGSSSQSIMHPIYNSPTENKPKRSKCPRGAMLNEMGVKCGVECRRDCLKLDE